MSSARGCSPKEFSGVQDFIYFNDGQFPLRPDTSAIGTESNGKGFGVALCDYNDDGSLDIYVANDTTDNFLYFNDGKASSRICRVVRCIGRR